jgi:hypothetical protein
MTDISAILASLDRFIERFARDDDLIEWPPGGHSMPTCGYSEAIDKSG